MRKPYKNINIRLQGREVNKLIEFNSKCALCAKVLKKKDVFNPLYQNISQLHC